MKLSHAKWRYLLPAMCALGQAWPTAAWAGSDPTADDVRAVYQGAGLVVSSSTMSADGVVTLGINSVDSTAGQPTLRVYVFPTAALASTEHRLAHVRAEAQINRSIAFSDSAGPQLVSGYGLSLWRQNIALVQAAPVDDVGAFPNEIDCGIDPSAGFSALPHTTVALSFTVPLEGLLIERSQPSR